MINCPQLSKLRIIVLRCEERFHHEVSDKAPKSAESTILLPIGYDAALCRNGLNPNMCRFLNELLLQIVKLQTLYNRDLC